MHPTAKLFHIDEHSDVSLSLVNHNPPVLLPHEHNPLHELKPLVFLVRTRSHASGINLRLLTTDLVSGCDKRSVCTADALDLVSQGV
jgi:hypothetical protein